MKSFVVNFPEEINLNAEPSLENPVHLPFCVKGIGQVSYQAIPEDSLTAVYIVIESADDDGSRFVWGDGTRTLSCEVIERGDESPTGEPCVKIYLTEGGIY